MAGPLAGLKIVEMVGLGPVPFCGMLLADLGAEVLRIARAGAVDVSGLAGSRFDVLARGRRSLTLDLKKPGAKEALLELLAQADALLEGFRPGVMERMGLGPEVCLMHNPRLVYGRMTGWGQDGPLAQAAGHDINYIALSGILHAIGSADRPPVPPLNLVGDFGGGGMLLAFGVLAALHETGRSGRGQVVDAAMTEGSALLAAMIWGYKAAGFWKNERGDNILDGGAHFYGSYLCADGKYIAVAAVEPQFYALLRQKAQLDDPAFDAQLNAQQWPQLKLRLADIFRRRTRAQWCELLEGSDACFAPVLDWNEAPAHPHNRERAAFVEIDGVIQPAPAPRFSRTPTDRPQAVTSIATDSVAILRDWGLQDDRIAHLEQSGAI